MAAKAKVTAKKPAAAKKAAPARRKPAAAKPKAIACGFARIRGCLLQLGNQKLPLDSPGSDLEA